jgi:hypothetical protein
MNNKNPIHVTVYTISTSKVSISYYIYISIQGGGYIGGYIGYRPFIDSPLDSIDMIDSMILISLIYFFLSVFP